MNLKTSIAASVLALVAGVGCSSNSGTSTSATGGTVPTTSAGGSVKAAAWSAEAKAGVRQLMAMAYQGPELDCAADVITSIYSTEDWTYAVAHPVVDGQEDTVPARMKELEDRSTKELEQRCGIKDTRAEDKAKSDAMAAYNAAVDEWNRLTEARDAAHQSTVVVDGRSFESYDDWAKAFGKPVDPPR